MCVRFDLLGLSTYFASYFCRVLGLPRKLTPINILSALQRLEKVSVKSLNTLRELHSWWTERRIRIRFALFCRQGRCNFLSPSSVPHLILPIFLFSFSSYIEFFCLCLLTVCLLLLFSELIHVRSCSFHLLMLRRLLDKQYVVVNILIGFRISNSFWVESALYFSNGLLLNCPFCELKHGTRGITSGSNLGSVDASYWYYSRPMRLYSRSVEIE